MNLKALRKRIERINLEPAVEWEQINQESGSIRHLKDVAIPMTLTVAIATLVGNIFIMGIYGYSFAYVLVKSVISFIVSFLSMFLPALIITELSDKFQCEKDVHKIFKLFIYSFTAFWAASIVAGFMADYKILGKFIKFLGIYGIFPYWIGVSKILVIDKSKKTQFVVVSFATVIVVYTLLSWSLGFIVKAVYFTSLLP